MEEVFQNKAKRNAKDTVFTDLFSIKKYTKRLLEELLEKEISLDDVKIITLSSVMANGIYNDLGVLYDNRLIVLLESQSTYTKNITLRFLLYIANTYLEYINNNSIDVYGTKDIPLPTPEFYCIMTKKSNRKNHYVYLSQLFDTKDEANLELKVKVIEEPDDKTIMYEYQAFCMVYDEQVKKYGYNIEAVQETIRICMAEDILREYLDGRKKEVSRIMLDIFEQDYVNEMAIKRAEERGISIGEQRGISIGEERGISIGEQRGISIGEQRGEEKNKVDIAISMIKDNVDISLISRYTNLSLDKINSIREDYLQ